MQSKVLSLGVAIIWIGCFVVPVSAAEMVRFYLKNGDQITGEMLDPEAGVYRVRVGDQIVKIPHGDVHTTSPVDDSGEPTSIESGDRTLSTTVQTVMEELTLRKPRSVSPDSMRIFRNCIAEVVRGEWDTAIRGAERLHELEPGWVGPQILRTQLLSDRGESDKALRVAHYLERLFPKDTLAQRVAAEAYRRASFPYMYARTMNRLIELEHTGARATYEKVQVWWRVDVARANEYWREYRKLDPALSRPWCREGLALRNAELSLGLADWQGAQTAIDEISRSYPWLGPELANLKVKVVESRLHHSQEKGDEDAAFLALDTLMMIDSPNEEKWLAHRQSLEARYLQRGLVEEDFTKLEDWCSRHGYVFADNADARQKISTQFQRIGFRSLAEGQLPEARLAFGQANRWDAEARPGDFYKLVDQATARVREDLRLRRDLRLLHTLEVLHEAYPGQSDTLLTDFEIAFRDELSKRGTPGETHHYLTELRGIFARRATPVAATLSGVPDPNRVVSAAAAEQLEMASNAYPVLKRYFPHDVGTRWVYRTQSGEQEEHEVRSVVPQPNGGWQVKIQVTTPSPHDAHEYSVYFVGGDVMHLYPLSPPGEISLRYPLAKDASWEWAKDSMHFTRVARRPSEPLHLAIGSFDDYIVVEGTNSIHSDADDKDYSTWKRVTYVAGVGICRIEAEDPALERTLIEFVAPPSRGFSSERQR